MAVFKSSVRVYDESGQAIGAGSAYVHVPKGLGLPDTVTGTVSLRQWSPNDALPSHLLLEDGRRLAIQVDRAVFSDCSRNHILRYRADWPPSG